MRPNLSVLELSSGCPGLGCAFEDAREDWNRLLFIDIGQNVALCDALEHRSQVADFSPAIVCM